jgi:hypothetical protein
VSILSQLSALAGLELLGNTKATPCKHAVDTPWQLYVNLQLSVNTMSMFLSHLVNNRQGKVANHGNDNRAHNHSNRVDLSMTPSIVMQYTDHTPITNRDAV